jgi:asparagine synthase (glutamine-hydrolysing)
LIETVYADFDKLLSGSDADELLDRILYADMKTYLVELLMKQDQMSMSASIESRVPFLDHHLVEFICRLPVEFKLKGFETKRILRHAVGHTVPRQIVGRGKMGFPTPIKEWFRGPYYPVMERLLLSEESLIGEYIDRNHVRQILERHVTGRWNLQEQIWTLGNLELWLRIFIAGQEPHEALALDGQELACVSSG